MNGIVMKGFLKFFALVLLLVPAWIGFLTLTGDDEMKQRASDGPLAVVQRALQTSGEDLWVADATAMMPLAEAAAWRLDGLAVAPDGPDGAAGTAGTDGAAPRPVAAVLRATCARYAQAACWTVERLDLPAPQEAAAAAEGYPADEVEPQRLAIVQDQLRALGFEPGSADGVMGLRTEQAIAAYLEEARSRDADIETARALAELEAMGRLARAAELHAQGDYHGAVAAYTQVIALDPANVRGRFNRGVIYQDMGLPGLAIADFDAALALRDDHVMAYRSRGNAYFATGDRWRGFADHADGLGVRYGGATYLAVRARLGEVRDQLAPGFAALADLAAGAWDEARQSLARTFGSAGEKEPT
jgi:tetratricopeptide (TPR) repeat protein